MKSRTFAIALGALVVGDAAFAQSAPAAAPPAKDVQPAELIQSMEGTFGVHAGQRRNHTKGTCAAGEFVGTPAAAKLSKSALFSGKAVPIIARFSLGGGDPKIPDNAVTVRGMALEFRLPGGNLQHITMINTPTFPVERPAEFNQLLIAARADPKTGAPDPAKIGAFMAAHPLAVSQWKFLAEHSPPRNYFSTTYFSVHTFKFVDAKGAEHLVRWRFVPKGGEAVMTAAEAKAAPHDFLETNLIAKTKAGPVQWDMVVYVGQPGDPETNPTVAWPESREHFTAGTLSIKEASPQPGAACEKINFDPLVMADGMAPTQDPILLFRSPAYAISFAKRLQGN
jgi:catalase